MSGQAVFPAVVTAGGRISGDFAARAGTQIKALTPVGDAVCLTRVVSALRATPQVGQIVVIGPQDVEAVAKNAGADRVLPEGESGPENMLRGLAHVADALGEGHALLCATDVVCLDRDALERLLTQATASPADILFPVISRVDYEARFPNSPNTWAKIGGVQYTGGSIQLVRPAALERARRHIENVFAARKSQWQMARLLGPNIALKFALGTLTVANAERKASEITGCACRALMESDPRLALDIDTLADYEYVLRLISDFPANASPVPPLAQRR